MKSRMWTKEINYYSFLPIKLSVYPRLYLPLTKPHPLSPNFSITGIRSLKADQGGYSFHGYEGQD